MKNFIREKKIYCGDYLEVDIVPRTESEKSQRGKRSRKKKVSAPKQRNLNDKNARRYFNQLLNTNFVEGDLHVSLTYSNRFLPATLEEAEKEARNYIRRIDYRRKKEGLSPVKYVMITEFRTKEEGVPVRIHHHIVMNGGLDRDTVEDAWRRRRQKGEKKGKKIGIANTNSLQPDEFGIEGLSRYLMKNPKGKKRWSSSQNLEKPWTRTNDHKYSRRGVQKIVKNCEGRDFWEKKYQGYWLTDYTPYYNDITGWSIYLKLRKIPEDDEEDIEH